MGRKLFFLKKDVKDTAIEDRERTEKENGDSVVQKAVEANISLAANSQTISRHAGAASEYIKAYTGKNYQASGALKGDMQKSLKGIAEGNINQDYANQNVRQQAGYSAEVMEVAERNAEEILKGSDKRYARADDVKGHKINETKNDIVLLDDKGNEILGPDGQAQGMQMKFIKMDKSPEDLAKRLTDSEFRTKYPDGNYCVPSEKYDGVKAALADKEAKLQTQIDKAKQSGNTELAAKKQQELDYVRKVDDNLEKSKVTGQESVEARLNPAEWTAGKVAKMSHEAGIECAKTTAAITFVTSFARNISDYLKGDIDEETALKNLAKDTAKGAASAYVMGASSAALSAAFQNSSNQFLNNLATNYPDSPAYIISFSVQTFSIISKRLKGEITDAECFGQIGKTAAVMGGSIAGKAIGTKVGTAVGAKVGTAIGGKVGATVGCALGPVGAMVGAFVGSVIVSTAIDTIGAEINNLKIANGMLKEQRQRVAEVKARYEDLCKELDEYDRRFRETYIAYTEELRAVMGEAITGMAYALQLNDPDMFIVHTNNITHALGEETQFSSVSEFKTMVENQIPLKL